MLYTPCSGPAMLLLLLCRPVGADEQRAVDATDLHYPQHRARRTLYDEVASGHGGALRHPDEAADAARVEKRDLGQIDGQARLLGNEVGELGADLIRVREIELTVQLNENAIAVDLDEY